MVFNIEVEENKLFGKKEISLQVGRDYWISSSLSEFLNEEFSEVQLVMIGMLAREKETYDTIYNKIQKVKNEVASHIHKEVMNFNIKL